MTAFSISGLASGIDTASLITQLMAVAAQPQTQLKNKVTTENNVIAAYQSINTKVAAVQTAAQALQSASTWSAATATSSNSSVVASADSTATAGSSTTFTVAKLAMAQTSTFTTSGSGVVLSGTPPTFTINSGGSTQSITAASGSAADVAAAINAAGAGVRASVVNTDGGQVLQLTSTGTGTSNAFTVGGLDSPQKDIIAAQNAQITVGDPTAGGYTVSSQTNTFSNVIPGVTFTASATTSSPVTITTSQDTTGVSSKVQALVDAVNSAFAEMGTDTAQGGVLAGDTTITRLQQSLLSQVAQGFSGGGSYSSYGVSLTSAGKLTFDSTAFAAAYTANPSATQAAIGTALGGAYNTISTQASDPTTGTLTTAINADQGVVSDLNSQISDWTTRLADMQTSLQAKYAAMESAVAKLQSESTWLASALGQTTSSSSSSKSS